jgi:ribosomal protein L16 Arg81 hydroxylase
LIHPLSPTDFYQSFWHKKALVIRSPVKRLTAVKKALYGLNVKRMLERSASHNLHVWQPSKTKGINSYTTEDPEEALEAHEKHRASLYFGSSVEMRAEWCKQLLHQMGYSICAYFPGSQTEQSCGDTTGEIETFISSKGNYTDWHMDFQENFTI